MCSTMWLALWLPFVCASLLFIYLPQAKMLRAVHSHTFLISDPLDLSPFCLKQPTVLVSQLQACLPPLPPSPLPCSVLFWSHSCANTGRNLCQFILRAEELSVSQVSWVCPAGSLGCFLSLRRVYFWCSLSRQSIGCLVLLPLLGAEHRSFPCS